MTFIVSARYQITEKGDLVCKLCKRRTDVIDMARQVIKTGADPKMKHDPGCSNKGKL